MALRSWCIALLPVALGAGWLPGAAFAQIPPAAQVAPARPQPTVAPRPAPDEWVYAVRPGDSLWTLSRDYLSSIDFWRRLQQLNRVAEPTRIAPGTRLRIPFAWMKTQPVPARVVESRGEVSVVAAATGQTTPLTAGMELRAGDVVSTGGDGSAAIEFADGSRFVLGSNGRVVFDVLSSFGATGMVDTRVRLERGRSRASVTPRRGRFRIWTPAAATVVRGTEFRTEFDADAKVARTEVIVGTVDATAASTTVAVPADFGTTAAEGAPPAAPVPLLPAPQLGNETRLVERLPVRIAVPPIAGAVAYQLELAPDDRFLALSYEGRSSTGEFRTGDLADGTYALRLRAVDAQGLQGLDATSTLVLNARPEPPVLMTPAADAVVPGARPAFSWSRPEGATGYRFQLAEGETPGTPILDTRPATTTLDLERDLAAGRYAWRVAAVAGDELGPFGDWQSFTRRPPLPGLQPAPPQAEAGRVRLAWPRGPDASTYRIQIARDSGFSDVVVDRVTPSPEFVLEQPAPGTYHLRVKAIEADGYEGDFGTVQSFEVTAPPPPKKRFPWERVLAPALPMVLLLIVL